MATTLKAMRRQELHPAQRGNLASGPAIAAPDREEHVQTADWWPTFVAHTPRRQLLSGFLPLTGSTYSLGDDLAECFAEGLKVNRRRLKALYKRESGFVLAYVKR